MSILEELYYGNIDPFERGFGQKSQCRQLEQYIARHERTLMEGFSQEQKAVFEKFRDSTWELQRQAELDAFSCGFKLGGQLVMEVMTGPELT